MLPWFLASPTSPTPLTKYVVTSGIHLAGYLLFDGLLHDFDRRDYPSDSIGFVNGQLRTHYGRNSTVVGVGLATNV